MLKESHMLIIRLFIKEVEKVATFLIASPLIVEEIRKEISQEDSVVLQDILHTVELGDYNKDEGLELLGYFQLGYKINKAL